MSLTFPRKFAHGQKVDNVDVYGELFLWPEKTGAVALLFRPQHQELDAACLRDLAMAGSELVFCPSPD